MSALPLACYGALVAKACHSGTKSELTNKITLSRSFQSYSSGSSSSSALSNRSQPVSSSPSSVFPGFAAGTLRPSIRNKGVQLGSRKEFSVQAVSAPVELSTAQAAKKYGFEVVKTEFISEYNSDATLLRHLKTGAEVMSLVTDDENKTFGAVFRTPPQNSTGIPHILEHSVLCGSRKYPIKEPFVELMKGSLNTFLNAFTYPDRTCYPVASCNLQDYYNLVDVYLDAVLHPACINDRQVFEQEGWHYELEDKAEDLTFKGVVFNEMKGVYSSPDNVLGRECQQVLFPDNTYGVDSGGDPTVIPKLSFEEFQAFHAQFYHPSNGRFWFYGDDPVDERLRILESFLADFQKREDDSAVKRQSFFTEPKYISQKYAASETAEEEAKTFLCVNWLLAEDRFPLETALAFDFLNFLMLGTKAAPLQKALEASGLGEDIVGGGLSDELRQPTFSIGLKGVKPEDVAKVEKLVMETLEQLAKDGFEEEAVEAAVNTIEFSLRENNTGRFPRGLSLMLRSMSSWLYDGDAFEPMKYTAALASFKARLAAGEDVFGPLIRKLLIDNPHRVTLELQPDVSLGAAADAAEKEQLANFKKSLTDAEVSELIANTVSLKKKQETPDSLEALKCMPSLSLSDIPTETIKVPCDVEEKDGATVLRHDLFTNNVLYAEAAFDMKSIPSSLLPLVPLFCRCLTNMGTEDMDFVKLTQTIGRKTGGISVYPMVSDIRGSQDCMAKIIVKGKTMADKAEDLFELFATILKSVNLDDQAKFKQMVVETRARMEAGVVGGGHSIAAARIDGANSIAGHVNELMGGISYLEYIRTLVTRVDQDWDGVKADLKAIQLIVLCQPGVLINLTAEESALQSVEGAVSGLLDALGTSSLQLNSELPVWGPPMNGVSEGLVIPTLVNYVGKGANLYDAGYELDGSAYVISKLLGTSWLWDRVRVSGGAYGGFCDFDSHSGMFTYLSYRDPNLLTTLDNYDGAGDFLRNLDMDKESLDKAIIGCVGDIDAYQLPDSKGYTSMVRHLLGITDEERQARRDQILSTSIQDFKDFAEVLETVKTSGRVVAVASAEAVKTANEKRPGLLTVKNIL
eukprot:CAMPEP_0196574836 /NCGR_PEP_ID=MMETSP1081-20130531/4451_1 /TAXON_ID=36882 /ORGANISM="Pyramimonas amylifera, Strain CCMP720" /LENGTH=1082 /DNA_ID=CAMNT_0041892963 /DNA_START=123 /DNA_END=3371 /DNA_ORIENTATION=+